MSEERLNEEMVNEEVHEISIDELSEEEVKELRAILERFIQKYKENSDRETTEWLREQLQEELPDRSADEIEEMATEIVESVKEYDEDLQDLNENCKKGVTKASWFANKIQDSAKGVAINQFGNSLFLIDKEFERANEQLRAAIVEDSVNIRVNGILMRQHHICDFNLKAAMAKSPYRAVLCPLGETINHDDAGYGIAIGNINTHEVIEKYQVISNADVRDTILGTDVFDVDLDNLVVAEEQVQEVQQAFPNKKVTSYIGGKTFGIQSDDVGSSQIRNEQIAYKEGYDVPSSDWNMYKTKELVKGIGQRAGNASIHAALIGAGVGVAYKAFNGEKIEADEVIETALKTGTDAGVKCAASGALTVAVRKGALKIIPPGTPAGTIAKIASVGIENVKILWKVVNGEMEMTEALEHMGRTSTAMYAGMTAGAVGAGVGAVAFSWIPIVGPILGGVVGGMAGYMAGSKFGEVVFNGAKKIYNKGKELVKKGVEKIKDVGRRVADKIRDWLPW